MKPVFKTTFKELSQDQIEFIKSFDCDHIKCGDCPFDTFGNCFQLLVIEEKCMNEEVPKEIISFLKDNNI